MKDKDVSSWNNKKKSSSSDGYLAIPSVFKTKRTIWKIFDQEFLHEWDCEKLMQRECIAVDD